MFDLADFHEDTYNGRPGCTSTIHEVLNPAMIQSYLLDSTLRYAAPVSFALWGEVRAGARKIGGGGVTTGGRAP